MNYIWKTYKFYTISILLFLSTSTSTVERNTLKEMVLSRAREITKIESTNI